MTDAPYGGLPPTEPPLGDVRLEGDIYGEPASTTGTPSTTDTAKDQAAQVGQTAKDSGQRVAGTAAEQGKNVLHEGKRQARDLGRQAGQQVDEQSRIQKDKAVGGLRSLGDELHGMASSSQQNGVATDLARQAGSKAHDLAGWLDQRDPGALLDEVRSLARRKPGTFLLGAVAAGVVAGRLTRGAVDAARSDDSTTPSSSAAGYPGQPMAPVATTGADYPVAGDTTVDITGDPLTAPAGQYSDSSVGGYR